jgi:hypothetical protein
MRIELARGLEAEVHPQADSLVHDRGADEKAHELIGAGVQREKKDR